MAKQIKTIQCPQCGSAQQTKIKEDHYKCGNCGAEYFLDNDDINVNVTHKSEAYNHPVQANKVAIISTVIISIGVVMVILFSIFTQSNKSSRQHSTYSSTPSKPKIIEKKKYRESIKIQTLSRTGNTAMFYVSERTYGRTDGTDNNGYYTVFYDYVNDKILKEEKLNEDIKFGSNFEYSLLPAINREFVLVNQRKIYELNFNDFSFKDVSVELLADHDEFGSGIASAKFIYIPRGEGFVLMSNMGKEFYFVPSFNKIYKKDNFYDEASNGMRGVLSNAVNKTYYTFTGTSHDYPESDISLLKIIYKYNNGGPEDKETRPSWRKQYPYSGIIYSNTPFKKILMDKDRARVISYEDLTPERTYFSPQVLYEEDKDNLLIAFKPTIAPDEKTQIQLLNLTTKQPIWTVTSDQSINANRTIKTDKYYIIPISTNKLLKIDLNGENMEYLDIKREREY